jgi:hypothetical protein
MPGCDYAVHAAEAVVVQTQLPTAFAQQHLLPCCCCTADQPYQLMTHLGGGGGLAGLGELLGRF